MSSIFRQSGYRKSETILLRVAAATLKFGPGELRQRFVTGDIEAEADLDGVVDGWNTLAERLAVLVDMVAEADRRIAFVREGRANG